MTGLAETKPTPLSADEARELTEEVKADAAALWAKLLRLYEGDAHIALGYLSWGAYFKAEFGQSGQRGYQLLDAARVYGVLALGDGSTAVERLSERVARELAPLRNDPERLREALTTAIKRYGDKPTSDQVRSVVAEMVLAAPERSGPDTVLGATLQKAGEQDGHLLPPPPLPPWEFGILAGRVRMIDEVLDLLDRIERGSGVAEARAFLVERQQEYEREADLRGGFPV